MSCCDDFSVVYISLSSYSLHGVGKRAVLILNDSKSEGWRTIRNVSLENCSQIFKKSRRIQDLEQFTGGK